jgi:hypothetical protein
MNDNHDEKGRFSSGSGGVAARQRMLKVGHGYGKKFVAGKAQKGPRWSKKFDAVAAALKKETGYQHAPNYASGYPVKVISASKLETDYAHPIAQAAAGHTAALKARKDVRRQGKVSPKTSLEGRARSYQKKISRQLKNRSVQSLRNLR